jgi:hypothetical protein
MIDWELEAKLRASREANPGDSHICYMQEAWLLIALGRRVEGIDVARRAQRVWSLNRAKVNSPYGGAVYWDPWIAEAAVALAERDWGRAKQCAERVLMDFGEEDSAGFLWELAVQAQGRLKPDRIFHFSRDPERDLAEFDLRTYALGRAGRWASRHDVAEDGVTES